MSTYHIDAYIFNANLTQSLDVMMTSPEAHESAIPGMAPVLFAGRVHGNPLLELQNIEHMESPSTMRGQLDFYKAIFSSGNDVHSFKEFFKTMYNVWERVEAFHIIDVDDPMLLEFGEKFVHEQFTDYMAGFITEESGELREMLREYCDTVFLNTIHNGFVPTGIVLEPVRQRCGLPYEWYGAQVD
jgi:hypothetical protein